MYYPIGMIKTCQVCEVEYKTKEGKQKTCGKPSCGNKLRSDNAVVPRKVLQGGRVNSFPPQSFVCADNLPLVEQLPAEYLKRCHDFWSQLIGEGPIQRRIG